MSLTDGLIYAGKMIEGDDPNIAYDNSGNNNNIPLTNTDWVAGGLRFNASGEYGTIDNTSEDIVDSESGTIVIRFVSLSLISDGVDRFLLGARGPSNSNGDVFVGKLSDNILYIVLHDLSIHYVGVNGGNLPNWNTIGHQLAFRWDRNNDIFNSDRIVINIDGVDTAPSESIGETSWNSYTVHNSLGLGNDIQETTRFANGIFRYVYIYKNNVLTENEIAAIYNNPSIVFSQTIGNYNVAKLFSNKNSRGY